MSFSKRSLCLVAVLTFLAVGCEQAGPTAEPRVTPGEAASSLTAVPGRIEAEDYKPGGEGVGYHVDHGDWGTAHPRPDSMDLRADATASGGYKVAWIEVGQWFAYDVTVATPGKYTVSARVSAPWEPAGLHVEVDGVNVTGKMSFSPASGWVSLPASAQFSLSAGTHTLKVVMEGRAFELDALDVVLVQPDSTFLRGINIGGTSAGAVTVGGRSFVSETDAKAGGLTVQKTSGGAPSAWQTAIAGSTFSPAVSDPGLATLLNSHVSATNEGLKLTQAACNGTYQLYTYHLENNPSGWRSFSIKVQGATYETVSLAQNQWKRFGPYTATVSNATSGCNGSLNVELVYGLRDASIMGLEVWTSNGGRLPAIPGGVQHSPYVPSGYSLAFNDEFTGTTLDRTKWKTRYIYSNETLDRLNDEKQVYRDNNNHLLSGGTLKLMAYKVKDNDPNGINYESGMIRSTYLQRYGYFEARVKFPDGRGIWPAFWLNSDYGPGGELGWPPEIDILEYVVNGVEDTVDMVHTGVIVDHDGVSYSHIRDGSFLYADAAFNTQWTFYRNPAGSLANQWLVFGLEWDENTATTYLNGKKLVTRGYKWRYDDGRVAPPAHVLLNLAIGGQWAGRHGIDDSKFPQGFEVDYVRVYKKP